jgi:hypothetical protein
MSRRPAGPLLALSALLLLVAAPVAAQDPAAAPAYGNVRLRTGFQPDPHQVAVTAGGPRRPDHGQCAYGYVATAPGANVTYTASGRAHLYIYARSRTDTTLLVHLPDGRWVCNDDGLGDARNPFLVIPSAPSGLYNIWVGTYGTSTAPATLYISEADPR